MIRVAGSAASAYLGEAWGFLLNVGFIEGLLRYHPDVLIAGKTDEYAMFYCLDADDFASARPGIRVVFHRCPVPWNRG